LKKLAICVVVSVLAVTPLTFASALLSSTSVSPTTGSTSPVQRSARWTFWYVRIHNRLLGSMFGRGIIARDVKLSEPSPRVLRFGHTTRSVFGRISCVPATETDKRNFGCRWTLTVKRRGVYTGPRRPRQRAEIDGTRCDVCLA